VTASWDKTARVWDAATGKALSEPMKHEGWVWSAQFSADGQRVVTASEDKTARVWDIPTITTKDSADDVNLLADLAEATAGLALKAFGQTEILAALTPDQVKATRNKIAVKFPAPPSQLTPLERFLKWSVSGARTRTISPFSDLTVADWVKNRIKEGTLDDLRAAMLVDPANARLVAHFGMALANLAVAEKTDPAKARRMRAEADFQTGHALKLAPDNDEVKATTQNNLGNALYEQGIRTRGAEATELLTQAVAAYRSALEVFTKTDLPQSWAATQNNLVSALWTLGDQLEGEESLKRQREAVELLRDVVSYQADDLSRYRLASVLGGLAFNLVLNSQFAEAQTRCEEAQRLANEIGDGVRKSDRDDLVFIQGNLAHALLFQGHYDEALAIYRQYWDKPLNGKTFGEVTLEDFATFDKADLNHPDLSRIKRALGDLSSKASSP
jgi:tetratricopeptide (TPR) repeat protein